MRLFLKVILVAFAVLALTGTGFADEKITICGTGDSQDLLRLLAKSYMTANPGNTIYIPESIGSGGGVRETAKGKCDLGRVARPIKDKEQKHNLKYRVFANSPIVIVTNLAVKGVKDITSDQFVKIYKGETRNWKDIKGPDAPIYVVDREKSDSSRGVLEKKVKGFKDIKSRASKISLTTPDTVKTLKEKNSSIGYLPLSMAKNEGLAILSLDGVDATEENVASGKYPLVSPFGLVWKGELSGLSKAFMDYLFSNEAKESMQKFGAFPAN